MSTFRAFSSGPNVTDIALESALPGLNGALQNAIDQHRIALAALNLTSVALTFNPTLPLPKLKPVVPPAARLVGIETNPGPTGKVVAKVVKIRTPKPSRRRRKRVVVTRTPNSAVSSFGNSPSTMITLGPNRRKASRRSGKSLSAPRNAIQQYRDALGNPFDNYPPSVQAGSLLPLQKRTLFSRQSCDINGATNPYVLIVSKAGSTNALRVYSTASVGTIWNSGALNVDASAMNAATFNATAQTARCIAGGLAVEVKCSSTSTPPTVYAGSVFDGISAIGTSSFDAMLTIPAFRVIDCSTDNLGAYCTWRPFDNSAMELTTRYIQNWSNTTLDCVQCVLLKLGAATYTINPRTVYHMETNSGLDSGGSLDDDGVILPGTLTGTIEDVTRVGATLPEPNSGTLDVIVHALMDEFTSKQASRPSGLSLRSEGGLVGQALARSATLPTSTSSSSSSGTSILDHVVRLEKRIEELSHRSDSSYIKIPEL